MYIFAEPVTEEQVHELQTKNKEKIEEFERNILGLNKNAAEDGSASKDEDKWADIRADVEEAMTKDEKSLDPESNEKPMSSAAEDLGERDADDTPLEQFETRNRGPLYERKAPPKADHNAAAATADQIEDEDEDEDEDDNVLDEGEDENAEQEEEDDDLEVQEVEDEGEDDNTEVQEVEEEDEENVEQESGEDIEEESGVIDEEVEVMDENGDMEKMNTRTSSTTDSDADRLDSVAEIGGSTEANKTTESMAEETDPSDPDNLPDEAEPEAEAEGDGEGEDSQSPGDAPFLDSIASTADASPEHDILALTLTIRNKINDAYVLRPHELGPTDAWSVEYSIAEISPQTRAWSLYQACQARRKKLLDDAAEENGEEEKLDYYMMQIKKFNQKGREWKMEQDRLDEGKPVFVVGEKGPRVMGKGEGMEEPEDENEGKREQEDDSNGKRE